MDKTPDGGYRPPRKPPEPDEVRDKQIAHLRELGWKLADIGRAFKISPQRVHAILKRLAKQ